MTDLKEKAIFNVVDDELVQEFKVAKAAVETALVALETVRANVAATSTKIFAKYGKNVTIDGVEYYAFQDKNGSSRLMQAIPPSARKRKTVAQ
jgi:hypothetical protein